MHRLHLLWYRYILFGQQQLSGAGQRGPGCLAVLLLSLVSSMSW